MKWWAMTINGTILAVACERRGQHWRIEMDRHGTTVEHSVGMVYLAQLIANPTQEIRAVDLAAGPGQRDGIAAAAGQPLLDDVARRAYRRRLADLDEEIEEHEARHDLERAARVRLERDWLISELTAAAGLGGRARQFPADEERARIAVGKAIRRALDRIAAADEVIGAHLRASVHTGRRCSYWPYWEREIA